MTMISSRTLSRRDMIRASIAAAAVGFSEFPRSAFGLDAPEAGDVLLPFLDEQPPGKMIHWQDLTSWVTPNEQVFAVSHYGVPTVSPDPWHLEISGLVKRPRSLSLAEIKQRKRKTVTATLE